jgi:hypothetical protein
MELGDPKRPSTMLNCLKGCINLCMSSELFCLHKVVSVLAIYSGENMIIIISERKRKIREQRGKARIRI